MGDTVILWNEATKLNQEGISFVMVTITAVRGSSPQDPGAKMIVTSDGLYAGTVGGGKVELAAIKKSQGILDSKLPQAPETITWNLRSEERRVGKEGRSRW